MCSELKSISVMGVSDPEMFLTEKDLNAVEFNFLVRPTLEIHHECPITRSEEDEESEVVGHDEEQTAQENKKEEGDKFDVLVSSLKLKIPSVQEFRVKEDDKDDDNKDNNDGFKTPTSSDQKIPATLHCPPAPRKPKSLPLSSMKRKAHGRHRQVLLDMSNEIESLFPPVLLADLGGGKIKKKVRKGN